MSLSKKMELDVTPFIDELLHPANPIYKTYERIVRHCSRTQAISMNISVIMGLSAIEIENIGIGTRCHDYAKRIWPADMEWKRWEEWTDFEHNLRYTHPVASYGFLENDLEIADNRILNWLKKEHPGIEEVIIYHHENWNGTGYPHNLEGGAIPIGARILRWADAYDALRSPRLYRDEQNRLLDHQSTIRRLETEVGSEFDPAVFNAFMQVDPALLKGLYRNVSYLPSPSFSSRN